MNTQPIIQIGNSSGVSIPAHIMKDLDLKRGQKVTVDKTPDSDSIIIKLVNQKTQSKLSDEFQTWLDSFLEEDAALLDELAHR